MKAFVIAGTNSGCGKTSISIGLMHLLKKQSYKVAPFKIGPDFIDPRFHEKVLGTPSYNLDSFMLRDDTMKQLFNKHSQDADIAIAEGVMGFYDGLGTEGLGSTYETARTLGTPTVLIVACKGLFQSAAAIVKGFMSLKPNNQIKGVILNYVANDSLYQRYKAVIEDACGIPCIGYVPPLMDMELKSRHLGLIQAQEVAELNSKVNQLSELLEDTIDVQALLSIAELPETIAKPREQDYSFPFYKDELKGLQLGVAMDKAFSFYYQDNIELLEELGATIHYFSPLTDSKLPSSCQALYFGGGYPEVFASQLSKNTKLMAEIRHKAENNMPIFAECGGLMYLTREIINTDNSTSKMVGIFDCATQMTTRLKRFGYANVEFNGQRTNCHEFHKSELSQESEQYNHQYRLSKPLSDISWSCGLQYKNVLAGYAHIHFWSNFNFTKQIIELWKRAIM